MVERLSEALALVSCIDPDAYPASTYYGDTIDMLYHERVLFLVLAGALGTLATIDFRVEESILAAGPFVALTGKAITQLTQAGADDDKQVKVEVKADEMTPGYRYLRGRLIVGTAASDAAALALADTDRYKPSSDYDLASVDEIVA